MKCPPPVLSESLKVGIQVGSSPSEETSVSA
jgi:hypothetical protein